MAYQNINQYNFRKWYLKSVNEITDLCLASDEKDYNEEVVFSPYLIAQTYGERLPVSLDLNNPSCNQMFTLNYGQYNSGNTLVSLNYYTGTFDLDCATASTICDIGLTGIDNGLVDQMTGKTLHYTNGFFDSNHKFDRMHFDRRMKFFQVTGNTRANQQFSGVSAETLYEIVTVTGTTTGRYEELYGGFYQGFYKLYGYDYDILPERMHQGWTAEFLLKPRLHDEYVPQSGQTTLNQFYPENDGIFFYMGTRAEDKFYHFASGHPKSDSGYTRVTSGLTDCLTCDCHPDDRSFVPLCPNSELEIDLNCTTIYPIKGTHPGPLVCGHEDGTGCGCENTKIPDEDANTLYDSMSNALAVKFSGDPSNPKICVRTLVMTGDCTVTGSCETSGLTYVTGYTVHEYCSSKGIWDICNGTDYTTQEHWVQVDVTWKRYAWFDECDLEYLGGLGQITTVAYSPQLQTYTIPVIQPPITHENLETPLREIVELNEKWLETKKYRKGQLIVSVNGKRFFVVEDVEEIIPRALDTLRQRQVGVPFNMSWGGGTQGLHENLTFTGCPLTLTGLTYQQDPECFPNYILSGSSLSGLTTNILLERYFGGTFDGGISQFRFYIEPLSQAEIRHNFNLLKANFNMLDPFCVSCGILIDDFEYQEYCGEPPPSVTPTKTPTPTPTYTSTPTPSVTKFLTPTATPAPTATPTFTPTPSSTRPQGPQTVFMGFDIL